MASQQLMIQCVPHQAITARKDRNNYYEAIRAHSAVVTCSLFAPVPQLVLEAVERGREARSSSRGRW